MAQKSVKTIKNGSKQSQNGLKQSKKRKKWGGGFLRLRAARAGGPFLAFLGLFLAIFDCFFGTFGPLLLKLGQGLFYCILFFHKSPKNRLVMQVPTSANFAQNRFFIRFFNRKSIFSNFFIIYHYF